MRPADKLFERVVELVQQLAQRVGRLERQEFARTASPGATAAPVSASYVTMGSNATLSAERTLTQGSGIAITDAGPDSTVTIATNPAQAPRDAQYLALALDGTLTNERQFVDGDGLTGADAGAGGTYTLAVDGTVVRSTRTITAGAGLTGGGDLSANRTIDAGEGPGIDIAADAIGLGGDTILLYDAGGSPAAEYAATGAGLALALAAATSGDVVTLPAGVFDTDQTIPIGVTLRGLDRERCTLSGQVTLLDGAALESLSIERSANDSNPLVGVYCATGTGRVTNCTILCVQTGAGAAYAAQIAGTAIMEIWACHLYALAGGAEYDLYYSPTASGYFKARFCYLAGVPSN